MTQKNGRGAPRLVSKRAEDKNRIDRAWKDLLDLVSPETRERWIKEAREKIKRA